jgi:hypothetical protein
MGGGVLEAFGLTDDRRDKKIPDRDESTYLEVVKMQGLVERDNRNPTAARPYRFLLGQASFPAKLWTLQTRPKQRSTQCITCAPQKSTHNRIPRDIQGNDKVHWPRLPSCVLD